MQPNLAEMFVDLQSFEIFLEKMLADKLLFTQSEIKSIEDIIAQGIVDLQEDFTNCIQRRD